MQEAIDAVTSRVERLKKLYEKSPMINKSGLIDLTELKFDSDPITDMMSILFAREVSRDGYLYANGIESMYSVELIPFQDKGIRKIHRVRETSKISEDLKQQFFDWLHHDKDIRMVLCGKKWKDSNESYVWITLNPDDRKHLQHIYQVLAELYKLTSQNHIRLLVQDPAPFDERVLDKDAINDFKKVFDDFISSENRK